MRNSVSKKKPCVCIVVENLPVPLDRRVWQESCALRDAGYEVIVICPQMHGYTKPAEKLDGIQIYRHWIGEEANSIVGFFREYSSALWGELRLLCKAWRRHRFDIIQVCNPPDILFIAAAPFKLAGVKLIYDVHDATPEMFEAKFGKRGLLYWAVRIAEWFTYFFANTVIATNKSVSEIATGRGTKTEKDVFIVRSAPKIPTLEIKLNQTLKKGRKYLVGYVGVMGSADGIDQIIRSAHYLVQKQGRKDIQFLLMGFGPEYENLIKLRDKLGMKDFIDLPGRVEGAELFSALSTMDLGVSGDPINPYNHHCTMNKVLEYMAMGKPQVSFDLKESRYSAGDAALFVNEVSSQALGQAISNLIDDPKRRKIMGDIGHERFHSDLNWEKSVQQLKAAYSHTLSNT